MVVQYLELDFRAESMPPLGSPAPNLKTFEEAAWRTTDSNPRPPQPNLYSNLSTVAFELRRWRLALNSAAGPRGGNCSGSIDEAVCQKA